VLLVGFIIRKFVTMHGHMKVKKLKNTFLALNCLMGYICYFIVFKCFKLYYTFFFTYFFYCNLKEIIVLWPSLSIRMVLLEGGPKGRNM